MKTTKKITVAQALDVEVYVEIEVPDDLTGQELQDFVDNSVWVGVFAASNHGVARVVDVSNCGPAEIIDDGVAAKFSIAE